MSDFKGKIIWTNPEKNSVQISHLFHSLLAQEFINRSQKRIINTIILERIEVGNENSSFLKNITKTYSRFKNNPSKSQAIRDIDEILNCLK